MAQVSIEIPPPPPLRSNQCKRQGEASGQIRRGIQIVLTKNGEGGLDYPSNQTVEGEGYSFCRYDRCDAIIIIIIVVIIIIILF